MGNGTNIPALTCLKSDAPAISFKPLLPAVCRKLRAGKYEYRGLIITCVGYYEPDQKVCWEAYDKITGNADYHGYSKRMVKRLIDIDFAKNGG